MEHIHAPGSGGDQCVVRVGVDPPEVKVCDWQKAATYVMFKSHRTEILGGGGTESDEPSQRKGEDMVDGDEVAIGVERRARAYIRHSTRP